MEVRVREPYDVAAVIQAGPAASVPAILEAAADAEAEAVLLTGPDVQEGWHHGVLLLAGVEAPEASIRLWKVDAALGEGAEQLVDPPAETVAEWDRRCQQGRVVAIAGLEPRDTDLHNERFFRMLRNHLLCERPPTGRLEEDRVLVMSALSEGRCFIGRDSLANTRNFRFYADGESGFLPMGGEGEADGWTLHVRLPFAAELRVIRDGDEVEHRHSCRAFDFKAEAPGVYRVEARLRAFGSSRAWIISNPIYLRAG